jgi:hypothetical protein
VNANRHSIIGQTEATFYLMHWIRARLTRQTCL